MKISMIAAMTPAGVIGGDNKLLWHLPADLQHFKRLTLAKPIIMGRKTFESIGRPLPGRLNIVLSRHQGVVHPDVKMASSANEALSLAKQTTNDEVMIIGGGHIYQTFLADADTLFITEVDTDVSGDTYFPTIDEQHWQLIDQKIGQTDEKNSLKHVFKTYQRKPKGA
ncbi:type 3 dihydrofolate reductase [Gayadomonas joobiniege]|uniref:type 3 dihydrofolate reductase n=1 Tax=Gayadomonas joobiniege TaxID=1234606 RepID=UPI000372E751|nr:type 3 dihydrofolate reductase [Gayadomonas joobiniege]